MRAISCVGLAALLLLAACGGERPGMGGTVTADLPEGALPLYDAQNRINVLAPQASILAGSAPKRFGSDGDLDVLVLSGGGSNGAYGAGVLYGWTQSGKRPEFDVVTGVSTGALIAPLAFAGPAYDEELRRFYTEIDDRDVFRDRGLRGLLSNAVLSSAPLRARIAEVVTPAFLDLIAAEQKKGRRLYIASTDLDEGESVVWDMGGLAASDLPDKRDRFIDAMLASASVPGVFPPVFITDGRGGPPHMHVDGGVKSSILLRDFMIAGHYRARHVYMVLNACMCLGTFGAPVKDTILGITGKSISQMLRESLYRETELAFVMTKNAGIPTKLTYIPDRITPPDPISFDAPAMARLLAAGRTVGLDQTLWLDRPPRLQRFVLGPGG